MKKTARPLALGLMAAFVLGLMAAPASAESRHSEGATLSVQQDSAKTIETGKKKGKKGKKKDGKKKKSGKKKKD